MCLLRLFCLVVFVIVFSLLVLVVVCVCVVCSVMLACWSVCWLCNRFVLFESDCDDVFRIAVLL